MAKAYTPGLTVTNRITHRCVRQLPIPGTVRVALGDAVGARDVVAETFMPGDVTPVNLSNLLSAPPADIPEFMLKQEGDTVEKGEPIARTKGIFGFFKKDFRSPIAGTLETVSSITGQLIMRGAPLPVQVRAYLTGKVVEILEDEGCVIEAEVTFVQGIFGIGGEAFGPIRVVCGGPHEDLTTERITPELKGAIVVGGRRVDLATLQRAREAGASAVVAGGIDDEDLKRFLGYDLGVAITGSEEVGLTVVITEGFGDIAMAERTFSLLQSREGDDASVNGATQIRAGVMRPEILVPLSAEQMQEEREPAHTEGFLELGIPVRVIRDPYFGKIGTVSALPPELTVLDSGSRARVLEVDLESGETVVIPRANVELIVS
jgi:hypothetical protein